MTSLRFLHVDGAVRVGLMGVVFIIGVGPVVWDPGGVQAFLHLKLLAGAAAVLVGAVAIRGSGLAVPGNRVVFFAAVGLLLWGALAAAMATSPAIAVLGSSSRQFGLITWMMHGAAFVVVLTVFTRVDDGGSAASAVALGAAIGVAVAGGVAVLEWLGWQPLTFNQTFGGRVQSVFGNPAVLGGYLVLLCPIVVGAAIAQRSTARLVTGAIAAAGAAAILLSGSRGAWLGLLVACATWLAASFATAPQRWRRLAFGAAGVVAIVAITIPSGRWNAVGEDIEGRLAIWNIGAATLANHPVAGVGPEGFSAAFGEQVSDDFVITYTRDQQWDRAHNSILDVGVAAGLPGMVAYAVLISGVLIVGWRSLRASDILIKSAAIGVIAYVVHQLTFFQDATTDPAFWAIVAFITARHASTRKLHTPALPLAVGVLAVAVGAYAALGLFADRLDRRALLAPTAESALSALRTAANLRPADTIHYSIAASLGRVSDEVVVVRNTDELLVAGLSYAANDEALLLGRANILIQEHRLTGDIAPLDLVDTSMASLLQRDPHNGEAYLRLGVSAYLQGDLDGAERAWREAARLMPHQAAPVDNLAVLEQEHSG